LQQIIVQIWKKSDPSEALIIIKDSEALIIIKDSGSDNEKVQNPSCPLAPAIAQNILESMTLKDQKNI
jgi:hypothetical protein